MGRQTYNKMNHKADDHIKYTEENFIKDKILNLTYVYKINIHLCLLQPGRQNNSICRIDATKSEKSSQKRFRPLS